jgi:hypothetical protein
MRYTFTKLLVHPGKWFRSLVIENLFDCHIPLRYLLLRKQDDHVRMPVLETTAMF